MGKKLCTFLFVFLFGLTAFGQKDITGKVTDENGNPIASISVKVKGAKTGTTTNSAGEYKLNVSNNAILEISGVGFTAATISVASGNYNVTLKSSVEDVGNVIVTGVAGATERRKMTVSVTKINSDRLNVVPATSAANALSGKVAGVRVNQTSGSPGGAIDVLLRGDNNLNIGSGPLILLDGVIITGGLTDISVDDVESMEVVKGAAAAALYGSRAGNGVIAVTSKRGSRLAQGTTSITVRNEVGFQSIANYVDLATSHAFTLAPDYTNFIGQYTKYNGVTYPSGYLGGYHPGIVGNRALKADHYMDNPFGLNIDQQKEFFNTGVNYTNHIGISSRSKSTNIYASFENNNQQGIIQNTDGYNRQNFRLNIDHQVSDWLKISASNMFINTKTQYPGDGGGIFFNIVLAEPDNNLLLNSPLDGQPYYIRHNHWSNERNPLYSTYKNKRTDYTRRFISNYTANIKLASWIDVDLTKTIEIENYRYTNYSPYDTWTISGSLNPYGISYTKGSLYKYSSESNSQNAQVTINTRHRLGDLNIKTKLSYLDEDVHYENFDAQASQFSVRDLPTFENFPTINNATSVVTDTRARNYFAILSLDYKGKFLFDGMGRYDGSSLFGENSRWAPYYRVSGAYRISQDVSIKGIDELKVRAAYGTAGLRPGFDWQYETYSINNGVSSPAQKGNKNLKPSQTAEMEFGLNVEFLKKFTFEATYAKSKTTNQFLNVPLIPFVNDGFNSQYQNAGTVESKTFEMTLGANWISKKDFSWNSNFVFSRIRSTITELPIAPYQSGPDGLFYIKAGEQYGAIYGYDWVRSLDQMSKQLPVGKSIADYEINSDGYVIDKGTSGKLTEKPIKLKDANGNLAFVQIGNGNANFNLGITNTLRYKNFSLYFLIDIKNGGDVYNRKSQWLTRDSRNGIMDMSNVEASKKKTLDYYQAFYDVNTNNTYWVENAGFVKFREVALGYELKENQLKVFKGAIKGMNFRVVGRNLFTITDYSGYDPEVGSIRNPYDGTGTYPNFRNVAFSLSLNF
jgi:TonB-linked SusC/RagA family outer membrane protein